MRRLSCMPIAAAILAAPRRAVPAKAVMLSETGLPESPEPA
jgi:hypothetical protein